MTPFLGFFLIISVIWAFSLFRAMFRIRRRIIDRDGGFNPGPIRTLVGWKDLMTNPDHWTERNLLVSSTAAVVASVAFMATRGTP